MPELVAANVEGLYWNTGNLLHELVVLEFCTCETEWDLLMSLLKPSPKLRAPKLNERHDDHYIEDRMQHLNEPITVPQTLMLMFGLETLEWRNYRGLNTEKELEAFILKHSCRLKTAIFSPVDDAELEKKYRMLTELALSCRGSTTCQLVFG
ncbi:unnamed protein product [Microthlaspi erraticum]|uniref:FBD domain-containing protein n=1 Tax=Microthlaspi erraticum TaxID=1685480 RepID=A0A6D2ITZ6_9BRAS|nr:unnamed protein product [Microthlaspi erraticum]